MEVGVWGDRRQINVAKINWTNQFRKYLEVQRKLYELYFHSELFQECDRQQITKFRSAAQPITFYQQVLPLANTSNFLHSENEKNEQWGNSVCKIGYWTSMQWQNDIVCKNITDCRTEPYQSLPLTFGSTDLADHNPVVILLLHNVVHMAKSFILFIHVIDWLLRAILQPLRASKNGTEWNSRSVAMHITSQTLQPTLI